MEPIVGCHPQETTNDQVEAREEKRIAGWEFCFWSWELGGEGERGEAMHALRTLFISCVRKVGKCNEEFFIFKKILSLIINGQSENDGWLAGWMDGLDWIGLN